MATPQEETAIRAAVLNADVSKLHPTCVRATEAHVPALVDLVDAPFALLGDDAGRMASAALAAASVDKLRHQHSVLFDRSNRDMHGMQ